jgi:hypothetical protein
MTTDAAQLAVLLAARERMMRKLHTGLGANERHKARQPS